MKQYISKYHFTNWFLSSDTYKNNFSYEGLNSLFDYLEQFEEDMGKEMEFDPVAICCEYSEYENLEEIKKNYDCIENYEDLENNTSIIEIENTDRLIIQDFKKSFTLNKRAVIHNGFFNVQKTRNPF